MDQTGRRESGCGLNSCDRRGLRSGAHGVPKAYSRLEAPCHGVVRWECATTATEADVVTDKEEAFWLLAAGRSWTMRRISSRTASVPGQHLPKSRYMSGLQCLRR